MATQRSYVVEPNGPIAHHNLTGNLLLAESLSTNS